MNKEILLLLKCPESGETLSLMSEDALKNINDKINNGDIKTLTGLLVDEEVKEALMNKSETYFYPIIDGIPMLDRAQAVSLKNQNDN